MRRFRIFIYLSLVLATLLSCRVVVPTAVNRDAVAGTAVAEMLTLAVKSTAAVESTATASPTPFVYTPSATPSPVPPTPSPTVTPVIGLQTYQVRYHPDGLLYVGDQVSLEVIAPEEENVNGKQVQVAVPTSQGMTAPILGEPRIGAPILGTLDPAGFAPHGLGGRIQATFPWSWDTSGLAPGEYELNFSILPEGDVWSEKVVLYPAEALLPPEAGAKWAMAESDCCQVFYVQSGNPDQPTAAERDLDQLLTMVEEQARDVSQKFGVDIQQKIPLVFMSRVIGHGGFAAQEIMVSYLDRNYAGSGTPLVVHHEIVHLLDGLLGGELRPSLLVEGLAVYLTGGHFKPEPLMGRAAALLSPQEGCIQLPLAVEATAVKGTAPSAIRETEVKTTAAPGCGLGRFIPLSQLADNFYPSQHEIGYLQAGALIEYMVQAYSWPAFSEFYRDIHPVSRQEGDQVVVDPSQAKAIDAALQKHFNLTLDELEDNFLQELSQLDLTPQLVDDVRLSVAYYDTLRHYQELYDPSAYYLYAWLPDGQEMRNRGIVADLIRRPDALENQALESMFVSADRALQSQDYAQTEQLLSSIEAILAAVEQSR